MAASLRRSAVARNAACDAQTVLANGGKLRFYGNTRPAHPETAPGAAHLVELTLANPAFGAAVAGVATANTIPPGTGAVAGDATWYRVWKADGTTALWDGTVGTASANCVLTNVTVGVGAPFAISSFTHTEDEQGS